MQSLHPFDSLHDFANSYISYTKSKIELDPSLFHGGSARLATELWLCHVHGRVRRLEQRASKVEVMVEIPIEANRLSTACPPLSLAPVIRG